MTIAICHHRWGLDSGEALPGTDFRGGAKGEGENGPPIVAALSKPAPSIFWDKGQNLTFGAQGTVLETFGKIFKKK